MSELPSETRESVDWEAEQQFVLWDYFYDKVGTGELTFEEAVEMYKKDLDG